MSNRKLLLKFGAPVLALGLLAGCGNDDETPKDDVDTEDVDTETDTEINSDTNDTGTIEEEPEATDPTEDPNGTGTDLNEEGEPKTPNVEDPAANEDPEADKEPVVEETQ